MGNLEDGPESFVLLLALMAGILGILELILEFEECVFDAISGSAAHLSL